MATTRGSLEAAIADELRMAIERRGITQVKAATLLGTSVKHLNQVLQHRAVPSLQTLAQWSDRLGVTWEVTAVDVRQRRRP